MMFQEITSKKAEIIPSIYAFEISNPYLKENRLGEMEGLRFKFPKKTSSVFSPMREIRFESSTLSETFELEAIEDPFTEIEMLLTRKRLLIKILKMIDEITKKEKYLGEISESRLKQIALEISSDPPKDLDTITDEILYTRLKQILAIEAMSGLLKDLTPEQIEIFNESIKRGNFSNDIHP